jgi:ABC-type siderophore export system fused ATPase/permease subunit
VNAEVLPRVRFRFVVPVASVLAGAVGGLGVVVLLQQYAVAYPTLALTVFVVVLGALVPVLVANVARAQSTRAANDRLAALEAEYFGGGTR